MKEIKKVLVFLRKTIMRLVQCHSYWTRVAKSLRVTTAVSAPQARQILEVEFANLLTTGTDRAARVHHDHAAS